MLTMLIIAYVGVSNFGNPAWWRGSPAGIPGPSASQLEEAKHHAEEAAKAEEDRAEAEAKRRTDDPAVSITPASGQSFRDRLVARVTRTEGTVSSA
jgi:hypothetical protein